MTDLSDPDRVSDEPVETESQTEDKHPHQVLMEWMNETNLCDKLPEDIVSALGQTVKTEYDVDFDSRTDWMDKSKKAMDLAMQVAMEKQYPWPKASNVIYPIMTVAAIQFAARAYPAIVSGRNVVRGCVIGDDSGVFAMPPQQGPPQPGQPPPQPQMVVKPGDKADRAARIGEHMSWQLLDEQTEWEEETDKLLHMLPIAGCCFRKSYFDPSKGRNVSILVPAPRIVINYHAKSMETAPRITEEITLYPLEIIEMERAGVFKTITYGTSGDQDSRDKDAPQEFLEQHRWDDFDEDGFPEPYVVTIHKDTQKVVRIVARYDHDSIMVDKKGDVQKIDAIQYYTKYDFLPNPEGGIYGMGFGQLLRPINEAVNTTLNMLIDAGHLANTGGGFIGKGLSLHTGSIRFTPGEYKAVNVSGATVKENVVPLSFPGPSNVLFQLLGTLIEAGKEIAAVKDVLTGEQKDANIPATTTLALIEQGLKVFTAIYKRIHRALKKELNKLYRLNSIYLPDSGAGYRQDNEWRNISKADYRKGNGVEPVSDPSMVSDMQKLGRAQFLMQFANDPFFQGAAVRKRMLDAANIEKPDELMNPNGPPPDPKTMKDMKEVQIREERMKAEAAKDYAQSILFLAQASQVAGADKLQWYEHQLEIIRLKLEMVTADAQSRGSSGGDGEDSTGAGPGISVPELEAQPGGQAPNSISPGLPPSAQGGGLGGAPGPGG